MSNAQTRAADGKLPVAQAGIVESRVQISSVAISPLDETIRDLRRIMSGFRRVFSVTENGKPHTYTIDLHGYGVLKRAEGRFHVYDFTINDKWRTYQAVVRVDTVDSMSFLPKFSSPMPLFVRTDSGCVTGQILHDSTCECGEQLQIAFNMLARYQEGVIVCMPTQDGRGMGQDFKLATLVLQDRFRLDTIEAARLLSTDGIIDCRTYAGAISVLRFLGVPTSRAIDLGSCNPLKAAVFSENDYFVNSMVPIHAPRTPENEANLDAKKRELGHFL